jgi:hypothetical protein
VARLHQGRREPAAHESGRAGEEELHRASGTRAR